ncbi:MAG: DNA gyrase inhibitor YacG [Pseudomonadota bacterium]
MQPVNGVRIVSCPTCGAAVAWEANNPQRPFCSERCRQIDLGAWANDSYRIAAEAPADEFGIPEVTATPRE